MIRHCMDEMTERIGGDGGAIAIDTKGTIAIGFNRKKKKRKLHKLRGKGLKNTSFWVISSKNFAARCKLVRR